MPLDETETKPTPGGYGLGVFARRNIEPCVVVADALPVAAVPCDDMVLRELRVFHAIGASVQVAAALSMLILPSEPFSVGHNYGVLRPTRAAPMPTSRRSHVRPDLRLSPHSDVCRYAGVEVHTVRGHAYLCGLQPNPPTPSWRAAARASVRHAQRNGRFRPVVELADLVHRAEPEEIGSRTAKRNARRKAKRHAGNATRPMRSRRSESHTHRSFARS
jgi:hypothetical protein